MCFGGAGAYNYTTTTCGFIWWIHDTGIILYCRAFFLFSVFGLHMRPRGEHAVHLILWKLLRHGAPARRATYGLWCQTPNTTQTKLPTHSPRNPAQTCNHVGSQRRSQDGQGVVCFSSCQCIVEYQWLQVLTAAAPARFTVHVCHSRLVSYCWA